MKKKVLRLDAREWLLVFILMGTCVALYFLNLDRWDLMKPDEPRYAQVAKEMVEGGDWILMHVYGKMYTDKPPLFFWMIAWSSFLWNGFTSYAVRFPSAVFGTLSVLLTFLIGRKLYSSRVGFLSGLILATSLEFAYLSIRANIDATLTFFTTFSIYCFMRWDEKERGATETQRGSSTLSIFGFYIGMGLATLTKGPIGFILPALVSVVTLLVQRDFAGLRRMKILPGLAIVFAMVLSWYVLAAIRGGRLFLQETLYLHTVDYYAMGWDHVKPFHFYLGTFPLDFMPWGLFFPFAVAYGFARRTIEKRREFFFLLTWFAVIFIFFSISKGKRNLYLLPLYPAASLMVGKLWEDFILHQMTGVWHRILSLLFYVCLGAGLIAGVGILWFVSKKPSFEVPYGLWVAFTLIAVSLGSFIFYASRRYGVLFLLLALIVGGGFFYTQYALFPLVSEFKSTRAFVNDVKKDLGLDRFLKGKKATQAEEAGSP